MQIKFLNPDIITTTKYFRKLMLSAFLAGNSIFTFAASPADFNSEHFSSTLLFASLLTLEQKKEIFHQPTTFSSLKHFIPDLAILDDCKEDSNNHYNSFQIFSFKIGFHTLPFFSFLCGSLKRGSYSNEEGASGKSETPTEALNLYRKSGGGGGGDDGDDKRNNKKQPEDAGDATLTPLKIQYWIRWLYDILNQEPSPRARQMFRAISYELHQNNVLITPRDCQFDNASAISSDSTLEWNHVFEHLSTEIWKQAKSSNEKKDYVLHTVVILAEQISKLKTTAKVAIELAYRSVDESAIQGTPTLQTSEHTRIANFLECKMRKEIPPSLKINQ